MQKRTEVMTDSIRLCQEKDKTRWLSLPAKHDEELVEAGYNLAGPFVDLSVLSQDERSCLRGLLNFPKDWQEPDQSKLESELLAKCPRYGYVPPIDLDFQADLSSLRKEHLAKDAIKKINETLKEVGLGIPRWYLSGGKGFHGELRIPFSVRDPYLLPVIGMMVQEAIDKAGLHKLTDYRRKEDRPPLVIDDSLYFKQPTSRGGVWRIKGGMHPSGKKKRVVCAYSDLLTGYPPEKASKKKLRSAIDAFHKERNKPAQKRSKRLPRGFQASDPSRDAISQEISTWPRVQVCEECGESRCRVGPEGQIWCYRSQDGINGSMVRGRIKTDTFASRRKMNSSHSGGADILDRISKALGEVDISEYFTTPCPKPYYVSFKGTRKGEKEATALKGFSHQCSAWNCKVCARRIARKWVLDLYEFIIVSKSLVIIECGPKDYEARKKWMERRGVKGRYVRLKKDNGDLWILANIPGINEDVTIKAEDALVQMCQVLRAFNYDSGQIRRISTGAAWRHKRKPPEPPKDDGWIWEKMFTPVEPLSFGRLAKSMGANVQFSVEFKKNTRRVMTVVTVLCKPGQTINDLLYPKRGAPRASPIEAI